MAKSFLMRDSAGHVGGYLVCANGKVFLKSDAGANGCAFLALLDTEGAVGRIPVCCDGQEHAYEYGGKVEQAALLDTRGGVLMSSAKSGAQGIEWMRRIGESEKAEENDDEGAQIGPAQDDPCMRKQAQYERCLPERRWPPPACMPDARYQNGVWNEAQVFAKAQEQTPIAEEADYS